MTEIAGTIFK